MVLRYSDITPKKSAILLRKGVPTMPEKKKVRELVEALTKRVEALEKVEKAGPKPKTKKG